MSGFTFVLSGADAIKRIAETLWRVPRGWVVIIREARRTNEQNDKMWAMLTDVSRAKPGGRVLKPDQWKCLFMDATAKETKNAAFTTRWEPSLDGEGVVNVGYRSSKLSKTEMGDLITFIQSWGDEQGVPWSDRVSGSDPQGENGRSPVECEAAQSGGASRNAQTQSNSGASHDHP